MGVLDFLKRVKNIRLLPPRDKEFYRLFDETVDNLIDASSMLIELFDAPVAERPIISRKIETCLTHCNRINESIEDLLNRSQQPPFDRSEISQFNDDTFRIMKHINHAANRYVIYDFPTSDKEMRELAPIIHQACEEITKAVKALPHDRRIEPYFRAVDRLETQADEIYHEGLRRINLENLIKSIEDAGHTGELLPVIKANVEYTRHAAVFFILRQVYEELERSIDACTELTGTLRRLVAENV
jgi:uncharacterized protein Yka (UPF0111/DUF47 family)